MATTRPTSWSSRRRGRILRDGPDVSARNPLAICGGPAVEYVSNALGTLGETEFEFDLSGLAANKHAAVDIKRDHIDLYYCRLIDVNDDVKTISQIIPETVRTSVSPDTSHHSAKVYPPFDRDLREYKLLSDDLVDLSYGDIAVVESELERPPESENSVVVLANNGIGGHLDAAVIEPSLEPVSRFLQTLGKDVFCSTVSEICMLPEPKSNVTV